MYKGYIESFLLFFRFSKLNNVLGIFNIFNELFFRYKIQILSSAQKYGFIQVCYLPVDNTYGEVIVNRKAFHTSFIHNQLINTPKGQYCFPPGQSCLLGEEEILVLQVKTFESFTIGNISSSYLVLLPFTLKCN